MKIDTTALHPPRTQKVSKYFPNEVDPKEVDWDEFAKKYDWVQTEMKKHHRWFESGHMYNFREAEHKKIILGRSHFYVQFADFMYERYGERYYLLDYMHRLDEVSGNDQLLYYILDAEEIHINLEGVTIETLRDATINKTTYVAGTKDIPSFHATAWEINQVFHRGLLPITFFHAGSNMTREEAYEAMGRYVSMDRILDDNKHLIESWLKETDKNQESEHTMTNHDIIPGFDVDTDNLVDSRLVQGIISFIPLKVRLELVESFPDTLKVNIEGEIEGFNAGHLFFKLRHVIGKGGFRNVWLNLSETTLGDYRERLILFSQRKVQEVNGVLILQNPPSHLITYWSQLLSRHLTDLPCTVITDSETSSMDALRKHKETDAGVDTQKVKFPYLGRCPRCNQQLKFTKTCKGKCPICKNFLVVDEYGRVFLELK